MAIDYGSKRVGLAVTDENQIIANSLATVPTHDCLEFIKKYLKTESVCCFVVGKPLQMNHEQSESEKLIIPFINSLQKNFSDIPVVRVDERFTSKMAFQTMIDAGLSKSKRKDKALIDAISATLILQTYLEMKNNLKL